MTLSGIKKRGASPEAPHVLIPLLVDDPLWGHQDTWQMLSSGSLNPSFSG